ncbi:MAG: hypothetical protein QXL97_01575 [Candidatus Aenigmatarchaeota archaeon]
MFIYICERKKIDLKFKEMVLKIRESFNYLVYPLDEDIVLTCQILTKLEDLHDRVIVATAKLLDIPLITKDKKIINSKLVKTLW